MAIDFENVIEQWRKNSPRVNGLAPMFASIASGSSGAPACSPLDDAKSPDFLGGDVRALEFYDVCKRRVGIFGHHTISSIPYLLEEWCRLGSAMTMYLSRRGEQQQRNTYFHSIGSAEGVIARTVAELGSGSIYTLTNSSTPENRAEFYRAGATETAFFSASAYWEFDPDSLRNSHDLSIFAQGVDVILEDTCFQMHMRNRTEQVAWVCQNLRKDGVFVSLEKCSMRDTDEYKRRESQKDDEFKSKYFTSGQISEKKNTILAQMEAGQVHLEDLAKSISVSLKHVAVTWNSGNFYTLIASNNPEEVRKFCECMLPPDLPPRFQFMSLPTTLHGPNLGLSFRRPETGNLLTSAA